MGEAGRDGGLTSTLKSSQIRQLTELQRLTVPPPTQHTPPGPATRRQGWPPEGLSGPGLPELKAMLSHKNNTPRAFDLCCKILLVMLTVDHLQMKADLAYFETISL